MRLIFYISFVLLFIGCISSKTGAPAKPIEVKPVDTFTQIGGCKMTDTMIQGVVMLNTDTSENVAPYYKQGALRYYAVKDSCGVWYKHNGWKLTKRWMLYAEMFYEDLIPIHQKQRKGNLDENIFNHISIDTLHSN